MPQKKNITATEDRRKTGQGVPFEDTGDGDTGVPATSRESQIVQAIRTAKTWAMMILTQILSLTRAMMV